MTIGPGTGEALLVVAVAAYNLAQWHAASWPCAGLFIFCYIAGLYIQPLRCYGAALLGIGLWGPHHIALVGFGLARAAELSWFWVCGLTALVITACVAITVGVLTLYYLLRPRSPLPVVQLIGAGTTLIVQIICLQHLLLLPVGRLEGSPFISPVVMLAEIPCLIAPVVYIGMHGLLVLLAGIAILVVYFWRVRVSCRGLGMLGITIVLWGVLVCRAPLPCKPSQLIKPIAVCTEQFHLKDSSREIHEVCDRLIAKASDAGSHAMIIIPEAGVRGHWIGQRPITNLPLLIGGERREGELSFNTAFCIDVKQQVSWVDKRHTVPVTEHARAIGEGVYACWQLSTGISVAPLICSELLHARVWRNIQRKSLVVALCNDVWAPDHIARLFSRYARIQAIRYECPVLFAARKYTEAIWFEGDRIFLAQEAIVRL